MQNADNPPDGPRKALAAVCGLYCEACSWFIATAEDPERLERMAEEFGTTPERCRCTGCRSNQRLAYCADCRMSACAAERGIDFCSRCEDYPCEILKTFQAAMPHRAELWRNLDRIASAGWEAWMRETRVRYLCPRCGTVNSAYDAACRKCGEEPSCAYVARHGDAVSCFLKSR